MTIRLGLYQSLHLNRLEGNIFPTEVSEQFNRRKGNETDRISAIAKIWRKGEGSENRRLWVIICARRKF